MLIGEHRQAINSKGQLEIPDQVLSKLEGDLVVTRGFERNLLLFPRREWQVLAERLVAKPISNLDARTLRRRLFSAAEEISPDANGRITLPPSLREFAAINGEIILAGMFNYLELWSVEQWLPVMETVESNTNSERWDSIGV